MYTTSAVEPRARKFKSSNRLGNSAGAFASVHQQRVQRIPEKRITCVYIKSHLYIKSRRSAYPLLIPIVVNAHHLSASQAYQRQGRRQNAPVRPHIQNPDFGLGEPERRFNCGLEMHPLLHQVVRPLFCGVLPPDARRDGSNSIPFPANEKSGLRRRSRINLVALISRQAGVRRPQQENRGLGPARKSSTNAAGGTTGKPPGAATATESRTY